MTRLANVKEDGGLYYITPMAAGAYGIGFKLKWQADRIADAINDAYERGRDEVRSALRDILQVAKDDESWT